MSGEIGTSTTTMRNGSATSLSLYSIKSPPSSFYISIKWDAPGSSGPTVVENRENFLVLIRTVISQQQPQYGDGEDHCVAPLLEQRMLT